MNDPKQVVLAWLLLAVITGGVGCGLPKQWHFLADKLPEATANDPAYQMLCIWEPAEGVDQNGLPTRGFAGKITFFTRKQATGVRVRGDVMVSVFDDQGPIEERGQPLHNWEFLGDAWAIHLQDSSIGPSYSVFIPYSRKGNHQAQCALQVKFTPEGGGTPLYSDTVAVLLPGPSRKMDNQPLNAGQADKRKTLESITIPLLEKRKPDLSHVELGKVEREHKAVPASELFPKREGQPGRAFAGTPEETTPVRESVMETLPATPQSTAPHVLPPEPLTSEDAAKPLPAENSTERDPFFRTPASSSSLKHSTFGEDTDEPVGSNPFNR